LMTSGCVMNDQAAGMKEWLHSISVLTAKMNDLCDRMTDLGSMMSDFSDGMTDLGDRISDWSDGMVIWDWEMRKGCGCNTEKHGEIHTGTQRN